MAHKPLLAFLEKASQDPALQGQLNGAMDPEVVTAVAHAAGCTDVTAEQVSAFLAEVASQQAASGDQELEAVTGGLSQGAKMAIGAGAVLLASAGIGGYGIYSTLAQPKAPAQPEATAQTKDPRMNMNSEDNAWLNGYR